MMRFFVLRGHFCKDGSEFDFDSADATAVGEAPRCHTCGNFLGMLPFIPPIRGTLIAKHSLFDLSSSAQDILISARGLNILESAGIRGLLNPQPIEFLAVMGSFDGKLGRYFWAQTAWGAEVDRSRSNLKTKDGHACPACGFSGGIESYDRIALVESSWNGCDLFSVKGLPGIVLVTERTKVLCDQFKLKACEFVPAEEYARSFYSGKNPLQ
jgi:hypothetical protein